MFFDTKLMKSASLSKLWRLGHNQETRISNEKSLPSICDRLDGWISSDHVDPRGRMSLRSAAVLVAGGARLYLQELNALVEDVTKLDKKMAICRKRALSDIMEVSECQNNTKRSRSSVRQRSSRETRARDTDPGSPPNPSELQDHGSSSREISLSSRKHKMNRKNSNPRHSKLTKDQAIQTMESSQTANEPSRTSLFQPDLPFGLVLIHDNPQTRIPSKIILSTINPDILNY